ncbi:iron-hydroxamate ABC transporter substrate-binding protein [Enterococcus sp. BWT-B8]|uniref:iron-hydroxamate ABC transporter substrate-binding protein n=1 Tax=Enterococcus sp. BWT-B8 TaxID=2885157 RepID=UPI001E2EB566|nr:iron-hydroxamate ABC transporter substrate-binding protein [Enterococcus sp. BWT-B8]MCB5951328.1 iron-hydroxamate ABC transporter substrate-binding protein [Enterococcus sp. BWT-B8]
MNLLNKSALFGLTLLISGGLLAACGTQNAGTSNSTIENTAKERVLTDTLGNEVTIPANPKRIIASYLEDYLIALDETPVAQWTVNNASIQDYLQEELDGIPTISYDLPYEEILKYEPDLILVSSSPLVEGGKYDEYNKAAPTYVVKNGEGVTWRDQLTDVANVLNKEKQAEEVLETYDTLAADTKEELTQANANNQSAAVLWVTNNQVFMVAETKSSGTVLYGDLGLKVPELVTEISKDATADWSAVSLEKMAELDADNIFLINSDESDPFFEESVWKNLDAVKNDKVFSFGGDSSWLYNGPIANTKIIEDVKTSLLGE